MVTSNGGRRALMNSVCGCVTNRLQDVIGKQQARDAGDKTDFLEKRIKSYRQTTVDCLAELGQLTEREAQMVREAVTWQLGKMGL